MKNHKEFWKVQDCACELLFYLADNSTDNQVAIVNAGGILQIDNAMRNHKESQFVQQYSHKFLGNLRDNIANNQIASSL
eukprot:CAMPEP_0172486066 /NCGR_PEP_ID=MMETSP1066-20121228/14453_1 /TAXON_ID=671091 /ORGANISM="Coscinodiscus wailesii, Strain CCMP2513" /LENGTH=78 /DNA_ID=CAMNT_0013251775 /DNA_START=15 /DNA_END=248 /DNA_ORIENTATION=-